MLLLIAAIGYGTWRIHSQPPAPVVSAVATPSDPRNEQGTPPTNAAPAAPAPPAPIAIEWNGIQGGPVTLQKVGEGSLVYAVGQLTNVSDQQKFGVKVLVDLFDDKGAKIGSATDYAQSIDAGKSWRFRAMVVDRGAVKAEIKEVTQD